MKCPNESYFMNISFSKPTMTVFLGPLHFLLFELDTCSFKKSGGRRLHIFGRKNNSFDDRFFSEIVI